MKQSYLAAYKESFPGGDTVYKYMFKTVIGTREQSALMARANRQLSQDFAIAWVKCAILYVNDCFECLSPHKTAV